MAESGKDAKFFQRGKVQELRVELQADKKDKGWVRKKTVLKKIIANATMGNDMSALFPDVVMCMNIQVLEIKKMVCELYGPSVAPATSDNRPFGRGCVAGVCIRAFWAQHINASTIAPLRNKGNGIGKEKGQGWEKACCKGGAIADLRVTF